MGDLTQASEGGAPLVVGIDLGTSNCALSWARAEAGAPVSDFHVRQLLRPGQWGELPLLPSCLYVPATGEFIDAGRTDHAVPVVGELARWQGARVPGRLVSSAKSWLCHPGVDRGAAILPWGGAAEVVRRSPVEISAAYLSHLREAWDAANPAHPLAQQDLVVTVPASFDEVARTLTVAAARAAGLSQVRLVEEPQAAFSDFVRRQGAALGEVLGDARLVLVVDVGGGTTDLTLIQVEPSADRARGEPGLRRVAVGEHLMLGGDNMDAALARLAEERLCRGGRRLSPAQWGQLTQACREAKEVLLGEQAPERVGLAVAGEGSRLLGNTLSCELGRDEVRALLLDGFFPAVAAGEAPRRGVRTGLQELGLPYAQEPAVTRHVSGFLLQHAAAATAALGGDALAPGSLPRPDAILLNGGVFNAPLLRERLLAVLSAWWPGQPAPRLLPHDSLDLAVARGAVAHGLARRGLGPRVVAGAPHSLYLGLGSSAAQGVPQALCVVARGDEEGTLRELRELPLELTLNRPVQFPLLAASDDRCDRPGALVLVDEALVPVSPLHTVLRDTAPGTRVLPVHVRAALTELGTLELHCVDDADASRSWLLEFDLRAAADAAQALTDAAQGEAQAVASAPGAFNPAAPASMRSAAASPELARSTPLAGVSSAAHTSVSAPLLSAFGPKPQALTPKELRQLPRALEELHGPREEWDLPFLRAQWTWLEAQAPARRRSADHERIYYQLLGFFLRPGFGDTLDAWRCEQALRLFDEGVRFSNDPAVWNEFWVLFRRISGGLDEAAQLRLWAWLKPHLARRAPVRPPKHLPRPKGIQPEGDEEMVRLAASLEHLPVADKAEFAGWLVGRLSEPGKVTGPWAWALGRLGTRVPLYGSAHRVPEPALAAQWLECLLARGLTQEGAPFAAAQLARLSGDRTRDLDESLRERVAAALAAQGVSDKWIQMVREVAVLDAADSARALGDRLPLGLRLRTA